MAAIPAAQREIERAGLPLALITGVEISTLWENHEIHIVGLNIDIDHPAMTALLDEQKARRQMRGQQIAERLEKARIGRTGRGAEAGGRRCGDARPFCPFSGGGRLCQQYG